MEKIEEKGNQNTEVVNGMEKLITLIKSKAIDNKMPISMSDFLITELTTLLQTIKANN